MKASILTGLKSILKLNKYVFTILVFLVWMTFLDNYNFLFLHRNKAKLRKLKEQQEYYENKIESDRKKLKELQTNSQNLEKYAREQFLMKKENEDIFVVIEKD